MANLNASVELDSVFQALSDSTRRAVLARLSSGQASVSNLAREHPMALPTFMRHLSVLEASGLIVTQKNGRVRTCQIRAEALDLANEWIAGQRRAWNRKLDRLGKFLAQQEEQENGS